MSAHIPRPLLWWGLAVLAVLVLAGAWFVASFEQVPVDRHEGAQREAQRNEWLAAERLFARLGRPLQRVSSPAALATDRVGGVLILDAHRRRGVPRERAELILNWVADGGYLIAAAEAFDSDPVLDVLGVVRCERRRARKAAAAVAAGDPCAPLSPALPYFELRLPGDEGAPYRIRRSSLQLLAQQTKPEWQAGAWLHLRHGRGNVTIVDSLDFAHNRSLGKLDHADLLWDLLGRYQPRGEIRLATRLSMPTIWEWLAESAPAALLSLAVLVLLWLWRIVPRFGGVIVPAALERRELRQHLTAVGRCVWREGGLRFWLNTVRSDVEARLALRHPQFAGLDASGRRQLLAQLAGASAPEVWNAVTRGRGESPPEFTAAMQTLQRLDRQRLPVGAATTSSAESPAPGGKIRSHSKDPSS
jgi:hypothetical protein